MTTQFQVGQSYATRSICDYDCIYRFTILGRTAKTVKISAHGEVKTCRISVYNDVEQIKPFGSYSMCCILGADETADKIEAQEARAAAYRAQKAEEALLRRADAMGDAGTTMH